MKRLWTRYRATAGIALVVAAAVGLLAGLGVYLGGNSDYRAHAGWSGFLIWACTGAVVGVSTGFAALLGSATALASSDRLLSGPADRRVVIAARGAWIGATAPWITLSAVIVMTGGASFAYLFVGITAMVAFVTVACARVLLRRAEKMAGAE